MNQGTARRKKSIIILLCALATGGCLSKEESQPGIDVGDPGTQNRAPTISGNPQTAVKMGDSYSFTPTASDADGDPLMFAVSNLPAWAEFDPQTGTILGTPTLADIGVFSGVKVTVSDGTSSASLPNWDITVVQVALGSMTLSWTPPTQNTDGSALSDLAGYRIYYGPSLDNYPNTVEINSPGMTTYVIEDLLPDTYYVVATSVNAAGTESSFSNVAIKVVDGG